MKLSKWFLLLFFWCVSSNAAMSGNSLLDVCNDAIRILDNHNHTVYNGSDPNDQLINLGICIGFVSANLQFLVDGHAICWPENFDMRQNIRIIIKTLEDNPVVLNQNATDILFVNLPKKFACPKNKN